LVYLAYVVVSSIVLLFIFCIPIAWVFWPPLGQWLLPLKISNILLIKLLGIVAIAAGSFISLWAVIELRAYLDTYSTRDRLKKDGIYSRSRNPITLGNYVVFIGFIFTIPSWVMIVGFIIYFFHLDHKIKVEEKNLELKFGGTFREYKKRVGRYLR
jgi:protein-S-isoprenylcysteine O-methyltransferase Ste14